MTQGRVGVLVQTPTQGVHTHVGTTVFNNFTREYPFELNLAQEFQSDLSERLVSAGLEPVLIDDATLAGIDKHVVGLRDDEWAIVDQVEAIGDVQAQHRLDALVRVWPLGRHVVATECSNLGCTDRYADGAGLYTRGLLVMLQSMAVPGVDFEVILFDPLLKVSSYEPLRNIEGFGRGATLIDDFKRPEDLKSLNDAELQAVREAIAARMKALAEAIAVGLTTIPE
ncbi:MAG: hypothetical protein ABR550_10310 [Wenzhouxiangellaceae bacterium]